jgi:hypothetical protein
MATNPSFQKRQKERARQDRQKEKAVERARRKSEKTAGGNGEPGVDPDIAGIVPGPQPPQDDG